MTFDDVLPTLVRTCETTAGFDTLKRCCVVRDLSGRVRLVLDPASKTMPVDVDALTNALKRALRGYFVPPCWSTTASRKDEARLAGEIFDGNRAIAWQPEYEDPRTGQKTTVTDGRWHKFERRLSKQEWLESQIPIAPPWPLGDKAAIVTFYSFKGGVGRTTTLVACAWQLARAGHRVIVIDLDLEAPGVGSVLGAKSPRGVVDFLVDELATGKADLDECHTTADALGEDGDRVLVVPAGTLNAGYLEKLGRLDFIGASSSGSQSPIERALTVLLKKLAALKFSDGQRANYIFIDARAGLHDLAGLSLHRLAHVDILAGRGNEQSYAGLELSFSTLVQRKGGQNVECILVQTMVPPEGLPEAIAQESEFLDQSFGWFQKHVYVGPRANTVNKDDKDQQHWPSVVRYSEARGRFATLASVEKEFFAKDYEQLRERIEDLCAPPGGRDHV